MNNYFGTGGAFVSYGVICLAGAVLVFIEVPETRGYTLEQIEAVSRKS
jgi:hypothetical protein